MPKSVYIKKLPPCYHGVNYSLDTNAVTSNMVYEAKNMHLDKNGMFRTRRGSDVRNTTALNGAVTGIYDFRRPDGTGTTSLTMIKAGTYLYKYDGTTFTALNDLSVTGRPSWATFQNSSDVSYVFMADGTNFIKFDGTTVSTVTFVTGIGKPRYLCVYGDRLLAAGCDSDPYKVFVSAALDGTNWTVSKYWTMKNEKGDRITGLGTVYNYALIFQKFMTTLITEGNPDATGAVQIAISNKYGTSSHWSIQNVNNKVYFADVNHIYKGELREVVEDGLIVTPIDQNIERKYQTVHNHSDIVSVYDPIHDEIQWGVRTGSKAYNDTALVYNIGRSQPAGELGQMDVWSGWFTGTSLSTSKSSYQPYTLALILTSETLNDDAGVPYTKQSSRVYRGDENGFVYEMEDDTQYKDETITAGVPVNNNIKSEIWTSAISLNGIAFTKRAREFLPVFYQSYDGATTLEWLIDGRRRLPATPRTIRYRNIIPYWTDGTEAEFLQAWGTTVWNAMPILPKGISINAAFNYIQLILTNAGANTNDEMAYSGGELTYQYHGITRVV